MIPGEIITESGSIELNASRRTQTISVANTGDRPIQVGSHYHFFETNEALTFARASTSGMRLNVAAGTAVRFEPGQTRTVELIDIAGNLVVYGFQGKVMGALSASKANKSVLTKKRSAKTATKPSAKTSVKKVAKK